jgi:autotransporter-associated beta strand protein
MKKKNYAAIAVALVTGGLSARGAKAGLFQTPVINGTFDYDYINHPNVNYGYDYQLHGWFRAYGGEEWYANAGNNGNDPPVSFPGTFNNSAYAVLSGRDRGSTANTTTGEIYQQIGTVPATTTTINVSFLEAYLKGSPGPLVVSLFSGGSPVQNYSGYTGAAGVYGPSYSLTGAKLLSSVTLSTPSAADAFVQETASLNTSGGTPNSTLWLDFTVNNASFDADQIGLDNVVVTGPATTQLTWNGSTGAWNTTSTSWKNGSTSTAYSDGTAVTFDDTATSTAIAINTANVSPTEIFFNNSAKNYTISGTYGIAGGAQITKTGTGTVTITNANSFTGNVNISAGAINVQNSLGLGASTGVWVASGATLQLQGGISVGAIPTTLAGSGTGAAGLDGALVSLSGNNTYAGQILISSSTTIAVDSGTLNLSSPNDVIAEDSEDGSNYNLTLTGSGSGTIAGKVGGSGTVFKTGVGSWTLPAAAYFAGGLQVSAGTITLGGANYFQGGLTINGGTAVLTGQNGYSGGTTVNAGTLMIGDGTSGHDGTLPADGSTVTDNGTIVFNTFGSVTYSGNISGTGNLGKSGAGTLILSSNATANVGGINVSAGKLYVNSGTGASVSVAAGGTLGGSGEIYGSVAVAAGGSIEGGFGGTGTLLINGSLSFAGAGSINIGTLSNYSSNFALQVNQTLSVTSGDAIAVSVANVSGASTGTSYPLIRYGDGTTDPGLSAFNLTLPRGDVGTLSDANSSIDLTLSSIGGAYNIVWTGAANAANGWDTATQNWTYNGTPTAYVDLPGDPVLFDDTAGSNQTVAIKSGDVHPTSVTFNNSTYTYTITGPNAIAGSTALTVNGTGTVILENANSYTGGTFINSGTLQLGNGTSGHDGSITTIGGLIDNGTLVFDNFAPTTFSGVING